MPSTMILDTYSRSPKVYVPRCEVRETEERERERENQDVCVCEREREGEPRLDAKKT